MAAQHSDSDEDAVQPSGVWWFFWDQFWQPYAPSDSATLEQALQCGHTEADLDKYHVSFSSMQQTNKRTGFRRHVRRCNTNKPDHHPRAWHYEGQGSVLVEYPYDVSDLLNIIAAHNNITQIHFRFGRSNRKFVVDLSSNQHLEGSNVFAVHPPTAVPAVTAAARAAIARAAAATAATTAAAAPPVATRPALSSAHAAVYAAPAVTPRPVVSATAQAVAPARAAPPAAAPPANHAALGGAVDARDMVAMMRALLSPAVVQTPARPASYGYSMSFPSGSPLVWSSGAAQAPAAALAARGTPLSSTGRLAQGTPGIPPRRPQSASLLQASPSLPSAPPAPPAPPCPSAAAAAVAAALDSEEESESGATASGEGADALRALGVRFARAGPDITECPVCLEPFSASKSGVRLSDCHGHGFHAMCVAMCANNGALKCPMCAKVYGGVQTGTQPPGRMTIDRSPFALEGHAGFGTIVINYEFPSGIQGPEHPSPGRRFIGTTRTAYLPDSPRGRAVLAKLQTAWDRRLLFTVGVSLTVGPLGGERVIWGGVHQKSSLTGPHGYPDPGYLDRVEDELAQFGI